jgi:hypothetical protein
MRAAESLCFTSAGFHLLILPGTAPADAGTARSESSGARPRRMVARTATPSIHCALRMLENLNSARMRVYGNRESRRAAPAVGRRERTCSARPLVADVRVPSYASVVCSHDKTSRDNEKLLL